MDIADIIVDIVAKLRDVPGVAAIVLGGSRARDTHTPTSDVDLGLYYLPDAPIDVAALDTVAQSLDDAPRPGIVTPIGGWGPWINGGGWLTIHATPVDLLYRNVTRVGEVIDQCLAGQIEVAYQPGHPFGFSSAIWLSEVAVCQPLWDPQGIISAWKMRVTPYPAALRDAIIRRFFWEASFSVKIAEKAVSRLDVAYISGCAFRAVGCVLQSLFACNGVYWLNEKGALALAETFPDRPTSLAARVREVFENIHVEESALRRALASLESIIHDATALLASKHLI